MENQAILQSDKFLVFMLDEQCFALKISAVDRVVKVVNICQLPKVPKAISGIINYRGRIIPVINLRKRFGRPDKEIDLNHQLIIAHTSKRSVALLVDLVLGLADISEDARVLSKSILPNLEYVEAVAKQKDGMTIICSLDKFISLDEKSLLAQSHPEPEKRTS